MLKLMFLAILMPSDDYPLLGCAIGMYSPTNPNPKNGTYWHWTLTDGTAASYTLFDDFVPPMAGHGHCVYASADWSDYGTGEKLWFNAWCVLKAGYVCELPTYTSTGSD